jgi:hypothetical protein
METWKKKGLTVSITGPVECIDLPDGQGIMYATPPGPNQPAVKISIKRTVLRGHPGWPPRRGKRSRYSAPGSFAGRRPFTKPGSVPGSRPDARPGSEPESPYPGNRPAPVGLHVKLTGAEACDLARWILRHARSG